MAIEPSVRADVRHAVTGWPPDGLDGEPDVDLVLARSEFPLQIASDLLTSRSTGEVA